MINQINFRLKYNYNSPKKNETITIIYTWYNSW